MYSSIDQNKLDKPGRFLLDDVVLVSYQSADGSNKNAKSISIKTNKKIKFSLIFDKNRSLQKKIKIEQLRNETN